jgi:hypothetical protein
MPKEYREPKEDKMHMKHHKNQNRDHGMRSAVMPKGHFEKFMTENEVCEEKYASEFGNPEDLKKMNDGLVRFARQHKMKYE